MIGYRDFGVWQRHDAHIVSVVSAVATIEFMRIAENTIDVDARASVVFTAA